MFKRLIEQFSENLQGIRDFVSLVGPFVHTEVQKALAPAPEHKTELNALFKSLREKLSRDGKKEMRLHSNELGEITVSLTEDAQGNEQVSFSFPPAVGSALDRSLQRQKRMSGHTLHLYQSSLLSLTCSVEWFLFQVLQAYWTKYPEAIGEKEKHFSLEDLTLIGTIEDARSLLIASRVENIMRDGFEQWLRVLKERVKLSMGYLDELRDRVIEVFQRRNIVVHNGGMINAIYLSKVTPELRQGLSNGQHIPVTEKVLV